MSELCRSRRSEGYEGGFDDVKLPYMTAAVSKAKQQIIAFGGVNYGLRAKDGELLESTGLCSERYPCLSQRSGRKTAGSYTAPTGLYARGKLCVVDGTDFIYGGKVVGQVIAGEKQFATINTKIVIGNTAQLAVKAWMKQQSCVPSRKCPGDICQRQN